MAKHSIAEPTQADDLGSVERLSRDLVAAAASLSGQEARYLVDAYYIMQEDRKRATQQVRTLDEANEPTPIVAWLARQSEIMEAQIKRALDRYTNAHAMGSWMREVYGVGPIISAGLLAHIDIEKAPTAGHIWRYAGLDPTSVWKKGEKRPYNARLKQVCFHAGESFAKFSGSEKCFYGHIYIERKKYEVARNDRGDNKERAAAQLKERNYGKDTDAFKHLTAGHLPPGQLERRARRYAVKFFLSHLHAEWYRRHFNKEPPLPFPIAHMGHTHLIKAPQ